MKKFKKILMLAFPLLLLNLRAYAMDEVFQTGNELAKYGAILIAVLIIVFIIFLSYKSDQKAEEKERRAKIRSDENFETQEIQEEEVEEIFSNSDNLEDFSQKEIVDEEQLEEESLYNSVNEYVDNKSLEDDLYNNDDYIESNVEENEYMNIENDNAIVEENDIYEIKPEEETIIPEEIEENINEEETDAFTFDTVPSNSFLEMEEENEQNMNEETEKIESVEEIEEVTNIDEIENENIEIGFDVSEEDVKEEKKNVKKYTGKKINRMIEIDETEMVEAGEIEDDEEDEDIGVPTFDELLKKSEEEEGMQVEEFDFMSQMEENLKKDQEKRLEKKKADKKQSTKKQTGKNKKTEK